MLKTCLASIGALAALLLATLPAEALTVRAWVSGHGSDVAGCGAPANACRTLQYVHDNIVAAGGEIDILDPAGYGTLNITKAISIVNDGVGTTGVQAASGAAITISAGISDAIRLHGLTIDGLGTAGDGVTFINGGSLTIEDCTVKGFTDAGVNYQGGTGGLFHISNTRVEHNLSNADGIRISASVPSGTGLQVTMEHVEVIDAGHRGIWIVGAVGVSNSMVQVTISDSMVASSPGFGIRVTGRPGIDSPATVMIRNTTVSNNAIGITSDGNVTIYVAHSTLSGNATAFNTPMSGVIRSYGDNNVDGNGSIGVTPTVTAFH
jgi:hypothetical protein